MTLEGKYLVRTPIHSGLLSVRKTTPYHAPAFETMRHRLSVEFHSHSDCRDLAKSMLIFSHRQQPEQNWNR